MKTYKTIILGLLTVCCGACEAATTTDLAEMTKLTKMNDAGDADDGNVDCIITETSDAGNGNNAGDAGTAPSTPDSGNVDCLITETIDAGEADDTGVDCLINCPVQTCQPGASWCSLPPGTTLDCTNLAASQGVAVGTGANVLHLCTSQSDCGTGMVCYNQNFGGADTTYSCSYCYAN